MKNHLSIIYRAAALTVFSGAALLGLSCVTETAPVPVVKSTKTHSEALTAEAVTAVQTSCASDVFVYGRAIDFTELRNSGRAKYNLESVTYRDVIYRSKNEVELSYRVEMNMRAKGRTLEPLHNLACVEENKPSARAQKMSKTTIPILGDLHLPSTRITVFDTSMNGGLENRDRLYNFPRISDISISSAGYFSFAPNATAYKSMQTLSDYLDQLKYRSLFSKVELREMSYGRIGIYAEKDYAGEHSQLLIVLVERN